MRKRYMPEDVFNIRVTTATRAHLVAQEPLHEVIAKLARSYRETFVDDGFEEEMTAAACSLIEMMKAAPARIAGDTPFLWLRHTQFFLCKYQPNGSRKPWRLLNGAFFTGKKQPVLERQKPSCSPMLPL
jgi:hypothetical protein